MRGGLYGIVMGMDRKDSTPPIGAADETNGILAEGKHPFEEPLRLPIEDALDLHAFAPKAIPSVVEEYLTQCRQAGLLEVRLIHGKGMGAQRAVVRRLLRTLPGVLSFADAPPEAGGWGATLVRLKPR